jgi:nicotinate-nucleotide pyrophosphorylase (carboxylating)
MKPLSLPSGYISDQVRQALAEDIGPGDVTARLLPQDTRAEGRIISREAAILCGTGWVNEVFAQLDAALEIDWQVGDGDRIGADQELCRITGPARPLLSGERTALNFLQTLSATASRTRRYVDAVAGTGCRILDTRKTIPGLRLAQKYAVTCGGGHNHRIGLFDMILIKENHIAAAGSITAAVTTARRLDPAVPVEVEVETRQQLEEAIASGVDRILLDNMDLAQLREAVDICAGRIPLEASGGIGLETVRAVAETGVDFISVGALTKHIQAVDLSLRFD